MGPGNEVTPGANAAEDRRLPAGGQPPGTREAGRKPPQPVGVSSKVKRLRVGVPWDLKRGGARHDVLTKAGREGLERQRRESDLTLYAPDCKTLSRARDRPLKGRGRRVCRLRSEREPRGLCKLKSNMHLWSLIIKGNRIADLSIDWCRDDHENGRGFLLENPGRSYLLEFGTAKGPAGPCA